MYKLSLNDNLIIEPRENEALLFLPDDKILRIEEKEFVVNLLLLIKQWGDYGAGVIYDKLCESEWLQRENYDELISTLVESNAIKLTKDEEHSLSEKDLLKFDRQIRSFATHADNNYSSAVKFQERLQKSKVAVLGVGGVGSYVSFGLTCMGIGKLILIDFDHIELSNTARQMLYSEADVGKQKIDIAKTKLSDVNPDTVITTVSQRITSVEDLLPHLNDVDVLILSADTPRGEIVYIAEEACQQANCAFIYGMPLLNQITVGPLIIPGKTRRYTEIFPRQEQAEEDSELLDKIQLINSGLVATIIDPYNAIAGKLVVLEVVKYLNEFLECRLIDHVFNFDTNTLTSSLQRV